MGLRVGPQHGRDGACGVDGHGQRRRGISVHRRLPSSAGIDRSSVDLPCMTGVRSEAIALGAHGEASVGNDCIAWLHAGEYSDVAARSIAKADLPLDEPARLLRIRQVDDRPGPDVLHGGPGYQRDSAYAGNVERDIDEHPEPELVARIRDFDTDSQRPRFSVHLWIDVAHAAGDDRVGKRLRRDTGRDAQAHA